MSDNHETKGFKKPLTIGLLSVLGVTVIGLSVFVVPKICKMLVDSYSHSVYASSNDDSTTNRQTSQTDLSEPVSGNTEGNESEHTNIDDNNGNSSSEPTSSSTSDTSESSAITDGTSSTQPSDNPYAGCDNVVYDSDKGCYVYIVQRNDTLSEISGRVHVSIDILVEINHIRNQDLIYTRESIVLP